MDERVFGRHEYHWWFRASMTAALLSPPILAIPFFFAEGDARLIYIPLLLLVGLVSLPLVIRYNTFSMTIVDDEIQIESWWKRKTFSVEDIVALRTQRMSINESTYVRVRQDATFAMEFGLQNYGRIRDFLLERSLLSRRQEDRKKAVGTHRYRKTYLALLSLAIVTLVFAIVQIHSETAIGSRFVVGMLILIGTPLLFLAVRDLAFQLKIDDDGVNAKWLASKKSILFTDVEKIKGGEREISVKDSSGRKIDFHKFLQNYEHIREYLFRACQAGKVTPLEDLLEDDE